MQEKRKKRKEKPIIGARPPTVKTPVPVKVAPSEILVTPPTFIAPINEILEYILKYGQKTCLQIARALNLDPSVVRDALNQLEKDGKIHWRRPLTLTPTQPRVVRTRVPDRVQKISEEQLKAARAMQQRIQNKQEEILRKRRQLLQQKSHLLTH
mgnify:CR=1 FL=1